MSQTVKVTVNLPEYVVQELREIATSTNTTMTEAIRKSIEINKYLLDQERGQGKVLIEAPDGTFKQIIRK